MPKEYSTIVREITDLRTKKAELEKELLSGKQQLKKAGRNIQQVTQKKLKNDATGHFLNLKKSTNSLEQQLIDIRNKESEILSEVASSSGGFARLAENMNDRYPILFFPVRIETVFNEEPKQLWIRIFPDEIAVDTHEETLSETEFDEGKNYWIQFTDSINEEENIHAWDLLCRSFSAPRAAYIALMTTPTNLGSVSSSEQLEFPSLDTQIDTWSKQPHTYVMPDSFTVQAYGNDGSRLTYELKPVPDDLKMGIDPTIGPDEDNPNQMGSFDQREVNGFQNEIIADETVNWMVDFDAAIGQGMAARIDITHGQYEQGFKRIMVVGVKSTLSIERSQDRVEQLLSNHRFTDGFSILKQGSNTNNTDEEYSGFQSIEFGNKVTYQTERLDPLFNPTPINKDKTDGQFLCEALGINYDSMFHIYRSNGTDIKDVINYNSANFQSMLGYTVTELLPFFGNRVTINSKFRSFAANYMRSRGALPSIRSGNQPYGILPTSVFSRLDWKSHPDNELFSNIQQYSNSLDLQWTKVMDHYDTIQKPGQKLTDVLSKNAVSTEYIQRVGVGAGYVWNNIEYAALEYPHYREWQNMQMGRMDNTIGELGLPLEYNYKGLQINYLEKQSNMDIATVIEGVNEEEPLPKLSDVGNMLDIMATASFDQLRDEDYEKLGVPQEIVDKEFNSSILYRFSRQSIMLEYFEAACDILQIRPELRGENEFINQGGERPPEIPNVGPMGNLSIGPSRLAIMNTPFRGRTISQVLSSEEVHEFPEAENLIQSKISLRDLAHVKVKDLSLLIREGIDGVTFRLDTWRLSLVNQRMNDLRGIQNGSLDRTMGLYLGAYGWVENLTRRRDIERVDPPTEDGQFPQEVWHTKTNKGYIHAPSMNQAVTGAVMLSGYSQRAQKETEDPLSVNLSSERVRGALDLMEGVRNGQNLGVLLGYEFERKFREITNNQFYVNQPIYNLRKSYPLDKFVVEVSPDPETVEKISSRSVVNGDKLIELMKKGKIQEIIISSGVKDDLREALVKAVNWIWNLADAVADISITEGIFQIVQGNTIKGGSSANAVAKGRFLNEPDVVPSIKNGLEIPQRFTMHFETNEPLDVANGWNIIDNVSNRIYAEPYINKWLASILPDPTMITCYVQIRNTGTGYWFNMAQLNLHPIDLLYLIGEELKDGDDLLSLNIKKYIRTLYGFDRSVDLAVEYHEKDSEETYSILEIHPVLLYAQKILNSSRHLNTHDYMRSSDIEGYIKQYDLENISLRHDNAENALLAAINNLEQVISIIPYNKDSIVNALFALSFFGIEQTVYEYTVAPELNEEQLLKQQADLVIQVANEKLSKAQMTEPFPSAGTDPTKYIDQILESFKKIFDPNFSAVPLFGIRVDDLDAIESMVHGKTKLTEDHIENQLLTEEWVTSIAKVRKNASNYEILSILTDVINPTSTLRRSVIPMQLPYQNDGAERWLGASVSDPQNIKEGRTVIGASVAEKYSVYEPQAGLMIEEWIDVIPSKEVASGIGFQYDQPNAKAPQCLILGISPQITGRWRWQDITDMLEETLDLAKKRGIDYEVISKTAVGQLPGMIMPFTKTGNAIGLSEKHVLNSKN
ncbi:hypothetical protein H1R17_09570 [Flavobacterium sp. xlx-214]|uniref:hypothetical protein n=1 Tax=unclassified Flavobacterium TaxID=196869 RepID=UPI0013D2C0BB|nr:MULTISPECIES: hypothetical protein [unclassified Flavobacterium]MBA5793514.1 hypothetical protein [Flavobacterium sp. xlx-221]QMI82716.1 hypothetical protein H1R17_09570 [Flavobacterium sp. xlx-214]